MNNVLSSIAPSFKFSQLFPENTVMFSKTTSEIMRWVGYSDSDLDGVTARPIVAAGSMPLICHANAVIPGIIDFYNLAGINIDNNYSIYQSEIEIITLAKEWSAKGKKLTYYFPPPKNFFVEDSLLVSEVLYNWLNDKSNINDLCGINQLPRNAFFTRKNLFKISDFFHNQPVYAKLCHPGVSGGGFDVFYLKNKAQISAFVEWLFTRPSNWASVRVEEAIDVRTSWCLNFFISPTEVKYLGAAIQIFKSPASQIGSLIDNDDQPSEVTIELGKDIAKSAGLMGYTGIAGFDIGEDFNGNPYVFDLNFRPAACTTQILFHTAATKRLNCSISMSWRKNMMTSLIPVMKKLEQFVSSGQLVPLSLFERISESTPSQIQTMIIAKNQGDVYKLESEINHSLAEFGV
jgi:hypothetical protein